MAMLPYRLTGLSRFLLLRIKLWKSWPKIDESLNIIGTRTQATTLTFSLDNSSYAPGFSSDNPSYLCEQFAAPHSPSDYIHS